MAFQHICRNSVIQLTLLVVIFHCALTTAKQSLVEMDKDKVNNNCGQVFVLDPGHEVRMTGKGLAPNGYCGVTVFTPKKKDNYTCDAICVTFKTASMSTCDVKLKFNGHAFGRNGDLVREFNCHNKNRESFCWNVNSMRVEVVETYEYAFTYMKPLYEFDIDVSARCTKDSIARRLFHATRTSMEEDEHATYVEGIAVGVSLACVFLVVLFIMWCYTKHQAVVRQPSDNGDNSNTNAAKKGKPLFNIRRLSSKSAKPESPDTSGKTETV